MKPSHRARPRGIPATGPAGRSLAAPDGTLVLINLVGGVDGLSVVVPHADARYATRRRNIAVRPPGERYGAIDLGGGVGLHPALAPLHDLVGRAERLALICGVGVPDGVRAAQQHLPARDFLHGGGVGEPAGWVARLLRFEGLGSEAVWTFGAGPHRMFDGLGGPVADLRPVVRVGAGTARLGAPAPESAHAAGAQARFSLSSRWGEVDWGSFEERRSRGYPEGGLARALATTADMIRADAGVRVVAIDDPGYDTHVDQGDGRAGVLTHRLDRLARALAAFWHDVEGPRGDSGVTIVATSEFGRSIDENDSGGTEHGRAGVALVVGDDAVGGVHGDLPDLGQEGPDWPVSVDVRRVYADAATARGFRPWRAAAFADLPLPNRSLGLLLSP